MEFVILDYGCPDGTAKWVKENFSKELEDGKILIAEFPGAVGFKMAHAKNVVHRVAAEYGKFVEDKNHVLCNLDADNFTNNGFSDFISSEFEKDSDSFIASSWGVRVIHGIKKIVFDQEFPEYKEKADRGSCGRVVVSKQDLYALNGYDEKNFNGWGNDDLQFINRLSRYKNLKLPERIPSRFLGAIDHSDEERIKYIPEGDVRKQAEELLQNELNTPSSKILRIFNSVVREVKLSTYPIITNKNGFGLGNVFLSDGRNIELKAIPQAASKKRISYAENVNRECSQGSIILE